MTDAPPEPEEPLRDAHAEAARSAVVPATSDGLGELAGDVIDRYTLTRELGEGGMGSVWMAEQQEPVKRRVALKIIKLGMDTREVVVRFEAERQALALMDHPHIAKVLDGGATESGRPYFVMELVEGIPITDYCDQHRLGLRERLELFTRVCDAIQHAHQKGVIHRDVKPSNVLVARVDGKHVPKVIDFGIAKATSAELTQKTLLTQHAQMIGTPEYMAPEQAELSGLDIDTRADVYALGALLYEVLTGAKLFDLRSVLVAGYQELVRTIREVDPQRPSTRVSTLGEQASPIAANRHVDADVLRKRLEGDLDWIVMKALEKDRTRRYETAAGFAADVERYLRDEPVLAAPPSAAYRLRKFVRRRKKTVAAALVITTLVIAGTVGTGIGWWNTQVANAKLSDALLEKGEALERERDQRELAQKNERRAREAEADARDKAIRAQKAEADAQARSAELERVAQFQDAQLGRVEPALMGSRMRTALLEGLPADRRAELEELLGDHNFTTLALRALEENLFDPTIAAIETTFADQPLVLARLMQTMATTLLGLGLVDAASSPQERALAIRAARLGDEHPLTLESLNASGKLLQEQGRNAAAAERYGDTLATCRRELGDEHATTLAAITGLGIALQALGRNDEAEPLYREVLATRRRVLGADHPDTLESASNMAYLLWYTERYAESKELHEDTLERRRRVLGAQHTDTLLSLGALGTTLSAMGEKEQALELGAETLEERRRWFGDEHPETLATLANLGTLLKDLGRFEEAERYSLEALQGRRRLFGDDHRATQHSLGNFGVLLHEMGRFEEAESYTRAGLESRLRMLGPDHLEVLHSLYNLAQLLHDQARFDEAEHYARQARVIARRVLGDDHPRAQEPVGYLAMLYQLRAGGARVAGDSRALGLALIDQGSLLLETGDPLVAEPILAEAVDLLFETLPEDDERLWIAVSAHAAALAKQGRFDEAEATACESADWILDVAEPGPPDEVGLFDDAGIVLQRVVELYVDWDSVAPGEGHAARATEWRERFTDWRAQAE